MVTGRNQTTNLKKHRTMKTDLIFDEYMIFRAMWNKYADGERKSDKSKFGWPPFKKLEK